MSRARLVVIVSLGLALLLAVAWQGGMFDTSPQADLGPAGDPEPPQAAARLAGRTPKAPAPTPASESAAEWQGDLLADPTIRVEFSGIVLSPAGVPVPEAEIVVTRESGSVRLIADVAGRFALEVPAGRYDLVFRKDGVGGLLVPGRLIDGLSGQGGEYRLEELGAIRVRFLAGEEGLAGAKLRVCLQAAGRPDALVVEGVTGSDGEILLDGLIAGRYDVVTEVRPGWMKRQPLTARPRHRERGFDNPLGGGTGGVVHGTVTDSVSGAPVANAHLRLWLYASGSGARLESETRSGEDGTYAFPRGGGQMRLLQVTAEGYAPWPRNYFEFRDRQDEVPLYPAESSRLPPFHLTSEHDVRFDVALRRGPAAFGVVRDEAGDFVPELLISLHPNDPDIEKPDDCTRTDADGTYRFPNLRTDIYLVDVLSEGWFLDRPTALQVDHRNPDTDVERDLTVRRGRSLAGVVVNGGSAPVAGVRVWVELEPAVRYGLTRAGRIPETFSDADGRWTLPDVPPGDELSVQAVIGSHTAVPWPLAGVEGEASDIRLVIAESGAVEGTVRGEEVGQRGATVTLEPVGDPPGRTPREARAGSDGSFAVEGLVPGRWRVTAKTDHMASDVPALVEVRANDTARVELELATEFSLEGIVVDAGGHPVAGASVQLDGARDRERRQRGLRKTKTTDEEGRFVFETLPLGDYSLYVRASGYARTGARRLAGNEKDLRIVLERD